MIGAMPHLDFADEAYVALVGLVKRAIDEDRFPYALRLDPLKAIVRATRTHNVDMVVTGTGRR